MQARSLAQRIGHQAIDEYRVVDSRRCPHPWVHRDIGEPRHGVDLVEDHPAVGRDEEVDSGQAIAGKRVECADRLPPNLVLDGVGELGRDDERRRVIELLGLEVVELMPLVDHDLRAAAGMRLAIRIGEHPAFNLARVNDRSLDDDAWIVLARRLDRLA